MKAALTQGAPGRNLPPWLLVVAAVSLVLCLWGNTRGLPSQRRTRLVFPDSAELEALIPLMSLRREAVYARMAARSQVHSGQNYDPNCAELRAPAGPSPRLPAPLTENKLDTMRSFLLQSEWPDEPHNVKVLSYIKWRAGDFNPKTFVYGGLFYYAAGASLAAASLARVVDLSSDITHYLRSPADAAALYRVPKILGALFFALSIPILFLAGRELFDESAAGVAVLLYAFAPITVGYAHFMKPHAGLLFWVCLCLWASARMLSSEKAAWPALAGAAAGFSLGAFWYAAAAVLFPLAAVLARARLRRRLSGRDAAWVVGTFFAAALCSNPYWLLDYGNAFAEIAGFTATHGGRAFSARGALGYWMETVPQGLGWPAAALALAGIAAALARRSAADFILLAAVLPFTCYAMSGGLNWRHDLHLSLPIVPAWLLLAGKGLTGWAGGLRLRRRAARLLAGAAAAAALAESLHYGWVLQGADQKERAGEYINAAAPAGASIGAAKMMYSGQNGYPPFRQAAYRLSTQSCPGGPAPEFYVSLGSTPERLRAFGAEYELLRSFHRAPTPLEALFGNHIYGFLEPSVGVYRGVRQ